MRISYFVTCVALALLSACSSGQRPWQENGNELTIKLPGDVDMVFVRVPAGEFLMGSVNSDKDADGSEKPQHKVTLDEYWIGKYEVTNAQYAAYIKAKNLSWSMPKGMENHPVVNVSWDDAVAFCTWLSELSGRLAHLPTEAQWEKAARGTGGAIYPWGNSQPSCTLTQYNLCSIGTMPVGSKLAGVSPYGALDTAGNVWEWVADWYDWNYYANSPASNPQGPTSGHSRVLRGGGFAEGSPSVRAAKRDRSDLNLRSIILGFRVAVSAITSSSPAPATTR